MSVSLGFRPVGLSVRVTPASTFSAVLRSSAGNWAGGTAIDLKFYNAAGTLVATWPAAVAADLATWTETPTAVDALIAAAPTRAVLWYTDGTNPVEWAHGTMTVAP